MTITKKYLAVDLGGGSGRLIVGTISEGKLNLEEVHRFDNNPVKVNGSIYWDILRIFHEIKAGIINCVNAGHSDIESIAIDTWGVDFGLLDTNGQLIGNPLHYRDSRTIGIPEKVNNIVDAATLFSRTGHPSCEINTLFQLASMNYKQHSQLKTAKTLLFTPDLLGYFLTGKKSTEPTIAGTSQLLNVKTLQWDTELLGILGIPTNILPEIRETGSMQGTILPDLAEELGIGQIPVIATAGHDTQCAITAVPSANSGNEVFISSGTWSILGCESDTPYTSENVLNAGFANELGYEYKFNLLKNIMGLWLVQESKRMIDKAGIKIGYGELVKEAAQAESHRSFVMPNDQCFVAPDNMLKTIRHFCESTGQYVPKTNGEIIRCVQESLACEYRSCIDDLEKLTGKTFKTINMIGGGTQDKAICQYTANVTGRTVHAGPIEGTAAGNIAIQAISSGELSSVPAAKQLIGDSFEIKIYQPQDQENWERAYQRYADLKATI